MVDSVVVSPATAMLDSGQTVQLTATVYGTSGVPTTVQFRTAPNQAFTLSSTGLVTALVPPSGARSATGVVAAISTFDTTKGGIAAITVRAPVRILGMQVVPSAATLAVGQTLAMSVIVNAAPGVNAAVAWRSSNPQVATVTPNGIVTSVSVGAATIIATAVADTTFFRSAVITVVGGVSSVTVSPPSATMNIGATLQAVANVAANSGVPRTVTWSSSNSTVATVSASGVITALSSGTASIIARSTFDTTRFGALALTVSHRPSSVTVNSIVTATTPAIPVNLNNIAGVIDITLTVDPGDDQVGLAEARFGNVSLCSLPFSPPLRLRTATTLRCDTRTLPEGPTTFSAVITLTQPSGVLRSTPAQPATINNIP